MAFIEYTGQFTYSSRTKKEDKNGMLMKP